MWFILLIQKLKKTATECHLLLKFCLSYLEAWSNSEADFQVVDPLKPADENELLDFHPNRRRFHFHSIHLMLT